MVFDQFALKSKIKIFKAYSSVVLSIKQTLKTYIYTDSTYHCLITWALLMAKARNFLEFTEFPSIVLHRSFWIQASGEPKTTEIFSFFIKVTSSSVQELMLAAVTPLPLKYST